MNNFLYSKHYTILGESLLEFTPNINFNLDGNRRSNITFKIISNTKMAKSSTNDIKTTMNIIFSNNYSTTGETKNTTVQTNKKDIKRMYIYYCKFSKYCKY